MAIVKLNPFNPWFLDSFDEDREWPALRLGNDLDVYETDSEVVVKAAVPGIPAEKVDVTFEDGVLRIQAKNEESQEEKEKKKTVYRQQRVSYFDYTTTLPRAVDGEKITADVQNGVITITAPIAQTAKAKKISVKSL